jgi:hypothetical protein
VLALKRFREKLPDWSVNPSDQFWGNDNLEWNFLTHIDEDGATYPRFIHVSSFEDDKLRRNTDGGRGNS